VTTIDRDPVILGIETSCDETAAAVVEGGTRVRSSVIATQYDLHERYAGVVPEIASRAHLERIVPVVREALREADICLDDLHAVAVGHRPGLIGSLLVGTAAAKALAWALSVPVVGIDHIVAHLWAARLDAPGHEYPALGLVVSGGHTSLFLVEGPLEVCLLGRTIDDAAGEAFDKAAVILGLGWPGGPALDRRAASGDELAFDFPVPAPRGRGLDFSFSGLKTALLYAACGRPRPGEAPPRFSGAPLELDPGLRDDLAASFQRAAAAAIIERIESALERVEVRALVAGGGVCANSRLRRELCDLARRRGLDLRLPAPQHCLDNAAMIAGLAALKYRGGRFDDWSLSAAASSDVLSGRVVV
jgi:N6-L-threonylcarbamoyladenine synthase